MLQLICGLILFLFSCTWEEKEKRFISFQWENGKATHLYIPIKLLNDPAEDSINDLLEVRLLGKQHPILGEYGVTGDAVLFYPLISFTEGLSYELLWRGRSLDTVIMPIDSTKKNPKVISIYPNSSELPENLLKFYIKFSKPMQEGYSIKHIGILKNQKDTIPVFLEMQPELWNSKHTILTLWLDPGRIKRGLQPNEKRGTPLVKGEKYELFIKPGWPDQQGRELQTTYLSNFTAVERDTISPDVNKWSIVEPSKGNGLSLDIFFNEALDYMLLNHVFSVTDNEGRNIPGQFVTNSVPDLRFVPERQWAPGQYILHVETRLEDLAGNNLNRLFDEDLSDSKKRKTGVRAQLIFRVE